MKHVLVSIPLLLLTVAIAAAPVAARSGFVTFALVYAVAAISWAVMPRAAFGTGAIVIVAVLLRLLSAFGPPRLSPDVYRYFWDGRLLAAGFNPYSYAPDDDRVAQLRDPLHGLINYPHIRTIYPPHAELLFVAVHSLTWWRLLLIAADVLIVIMLRSNPQAALAWATFPPAILEGAWNGHVDLLAGMFLLVAATRSSGSALAAAAGMKIIPIAAFPALFIAAPNRRRFLVTFTLLLAIPFAGFAFAGPIMPGLREYAARWNFNSPGYDITFALISASRVTTALKSLWTMIKDPLGLEIISPFVYEHLNAGFLARGLLAAIAVVLIVWRRRNAADCVTVLLLCSPAIHPWYWLAVSPLALLEKRGVRWVALCAPFSYLIYEGAGRPLVYTLCYLLPLALILLPRLSGRGTSGAGSPSAVTHSRTEHETSPL